MWDPFQFYKAVMLEFDMRIFLQIFLIYWQKNKTKTYKNQPRRFNLLIRIKYDQPWAKVRHSLSCNKNWICSEEFILKEGLKGCILFNLQKNVWHKGKLIKAFNGPTSKDTKRSLLKKLLNFQISVWSLWIPKIFCSCLDRFKKEFLYAMS